MTTAAGNYRRKSKITSHVHRRKAFSVHLVTTKNTAAARAQECFGEAIIYPKKMEPGKRIHLGLCVITVILLWTSSLSACRSLARSIISTTSIIPYLPNHSTELGVLATSLTLEAERYRACVGRQFEVCEREMTIASQEELNRIDEIMLRSMDDLNLALRALDTCELAHYGRCDRESNETNAVFQSQQQERSVRAEMQLTRLKASIANNEAQRDAFWLTMDCIRRNGRCPGTKALGDRVQDLLDELKELHTLDISMVERYVREVQSRLNQAESFIDSVRAISDHLAAVGINLGIPGSKPPMWLPRLTHFPTFQTIDDMVEQVLQRPKEQFQQSHNETISSLIEATEAQERELQSLRANISVQSLTTHATGSLQRSKAAFNEAIISHAKVVYSSTNASTELERLSTLERAWREISSLSSLAITLDIFYRVYRSMILIRTGVSQTRLHSVAYDGFPLATGIDARLSQTSFIGRVQSLISSVDSSILLGLVLFAVFHNIMIRRIYQPLMNDYVQGCGSIPNVLVSTNNNSLVRNANTLSYLWTSASGRSQSDLGALQLQVKANEACMNGTMAASEMRYRIEKAFRDRVEALSAAIECNLGQNGTFPLQWCVGNVTFDPTYITENGEYQCEGLVKHCALSCTGPHKEMVLGATRRYVCAIQGSFQSDVGLTLGATILFVCVNVGRALIVKGLMLLSLASRLLYGEESRPIIWPCVTKTGRLASVPESEIVAYFHAQDNKAQWLGWSLVVAGAILHSVGILSTAMLL